MRLARPTTSVPSYPFGNNVEEAEGGARPWSKPAFPRTVERLPSRGGVLLIGGSSGAYRHGFRHYGKVSRRTSDGRVLAARVPAAVYLWDVVGDKTTVPPRWDPALDNNRWATLCDADAAAAFYSLRQLASHPTEAVAFLRSRPVPVWDARLASRVCEALELIGTREARDLLARWAAQEKETSPLCSEASNSLRRLSQI